MAETISINVELLLKLVKPLFVNETCFYHWYSPAHLEECPEYNNSTSYKCNWCRCTIKSDGEGPLEHSNCVIGQLYQTYLDWKGMERVENLTLALVKELVTLPEEELRVALLKLCWAILDNGAMEHSILEPALLVCARVLKSTGDTRSIIATEILISEMGILSGDEFRLQVIEKIRSKFCLYCGASGATSDCTCRRDD